MKLPFIDHNKSQARSNCKGVNPYSKNLIADIQAEVMSSQGVFMDSDDTEPLKWLMSFVLKLHNQKWKNPGYPSLQPNPHLVLVEGNVVSIHVHSVDIVAFTKILNHILHTAVKIKQLEVEQMSGVKELQPHTQTYSMYLEVFQKVNEIYLKQVQEQKNSRFSFIMDPSEMVKKLMQVLHLNFTLNRKTVVEDYYIVFYNGHLRFDSNLNLLGGNKDSNLMWKQAMTKMSSLKREDSKIHLVDPIIKSFQMNYYVQKQNMFFDGAMRVLETRMVYYPYPLLALDNYHELTCGEFLIGEKRMLRGTQYYLESIEALSDSFILNKTEDFKQLESQVMGKTLVELFQQKFTPSLSIYKNENKSTIDMVRDIIVNKNLLNPKRDNQYTEGQIAVQKRYPDEKGKKTRIIVELPQLVNKNKVEMNKVIVFAISSGQTWLSLGKIIKISLKFIGLGQSIDKSDVQVQLFNTWLQGKAQIDNQIEEEEEEGKRGQQGEQESKSLDDLLHCELPPGIKMAAEVVTCYLGDQEDPQTKDDLMLGVANIPITNLMGFIVLLESLKYQQPLEEVIPFQPSTIIDLGLKVSKSEGQQFTQAMKQAGLTLSRGLKGFSSVLKCSLSDIASKTGDSWNLLQTLTGGFRETSFWYKADLSAICEKAVGLYNKISKSESDQNKTMHNIGRRCQLKTFPITQDSKASYFQKLDQGMVSWFRLLRNLSRKEKSSGLMLKVKVHPLVTEWNAWRDVQERGLVAYTILMQDRLHDYMIGITQQDEDYGTRGDNGFVAKDGVLGHLRDYQTFIESKKATFVQPKSIQGIKKFMEIGVAFTKEPSLQPGYEKKSQDPLESKQSKKDTALYAQGTKTFMDRDLSSSFIDSGLGNYYSTLKSIEYLSDWKTFSVFFFGILGLLNKTISANKKKQKEEVTDCINNFQPQDPRQSPQQTRVQVIHELLNSMNCRLFDPKQKVEAVQSQTLTTSITTPIKKVGAPEKETYMEMEGEEEEVQINPQLEQEMEFDEVQITPTVACPVFFKAEVKNIFFFAMPQNSFTKLIYSADISSYEKAQSRLGDQNPCLQNEYLEARQNYESQENHSSILPLDTMFEEYEQLNELFGKLQGEQAEIVRKNYLATNQMRGVEGVGDGEFEQNESGFFKPQPHSRDAFEQAIEVLESSAQPRVEPLSSQQLFPESSQPQQPSMQDESQGDGQSVPTNSNLYKI